MAPQDLPRQPSGFSEWHLKSYCPVASAHLFPGHCFCVSKGQLPNQNYISQCPLHLDGHVTSSYQ